MKILSHYIQSTIAYTTALVILALLGMQLFFEFVSELRHVGTGYYTLWQAIEVVFLRMPSDLYTFFPMVGLLSVLLGLSMLAGHNELTVMRAAGLSIHQIVFAVLKFVLVMVLSVTLVGETIAPVLGKMATQRREMAMSRGEALNTPHGTWLKDKNNFIHIRSILSDDHLVGITRFQFDDAHQLITSSHAKEAFFRNQQWWFENVEESMIQKDRVISHAASWASWALTFNPHLLKMAVLNPHDMTLKQLYETIHYNRQNGLREATYALSFWKRLMQPLATTIMMLLAIPFIFGPLRSATLGLRLVTGICVGFAFYTLNNFFGPLSLMFQFPPWVAALLPSLLFAGVGYGLLNWRK